MPPSQRTPQLSDQDGRFRIPHSATDSPAVRIESLTKIYQESATGRHVLDSVTATFAPGRFTVLLGRSGSGKSTLLN
ncbi:MAG: ATP-binding cassette domain-containing protein, partial [Ardenticatenaceae bacterium]